MWVMNTLRSFRLTKRVLLLRDDLNVQETNTMGRFTNPYCRTVDSGLIQRHCACRGWLQDAHGAGAKR